MCPSEGQKGFCIMNNLSKKKLLKGKLLKIILAILTSVTMITSSLSSVAAKVDLAGGVKKATNGLVGQLKSVFATVFGIAAVIALAFTIAKFVSAMIHYHKGEGEEVTWLPTILGLIATIVCGIFTGTAAFGWFGL